MTDRNHADLIVQWAHGAVIEYFEAISNRWLTCPGNNPNWYPDAKYRVALSTPSIDWNAVNSAYNYLARDRDGTLWLYVHRPRVNNGQCQYQWESPGYHYCSAGAFSSMTPGTVDWKDSVVSRPDQGANHG